MMRVRVAKADLGDMRTVQKLARKSPYTTSLPRFLEGYFERGEVAICGAFGFVIVHYCRAYTSLYDLGVDPEMRNKGVGTQLLQWVENNTPHNEIRLVVETTNDPAIRFWTKHGFAEYGRKLNKKQHEMILMRKQLGKKKQLWEDRIE